MAKFLAALKNGFPYRKNNIDLRKAATISLGCKVALPLPNSLANSVASRDVIVCTKQLCRCCPVIAHVCLYPHLL